MVSYLYILALISMDDLQCGVRRVEMCFGRVGRLRCGVKCRDYSVMITLGPEYVSVIFVKEEGGYEGLEWSSALTVEV